MLLRVSSLLPAGSLDLWVPLLVPSRSFCWSLYYALADRHPWVQVVLGTWRIPGSTDKITAGKDKRGLWFTSSPWFCAATHQHCLSVIFYVFVSFSFVTWWGWMGLNFTAIRDGQRSCVFKCLLLWENSDLGCSWWKLAFWGMISRSTKVAAAWK